MTKQSALKSLFSPFSEWIRNLPEPMTSKNYWCSDIDYMWFNWRDGWFITIEEKAKNRYLAGWQYAMNVITYKWLSSNPVDSLSINDYSWHDNKGVKQIRSYHWPTIEYKGHFVITMSGMTPDDSVSIVVNGKQVTADDVRWLLEYGELK